VFGALGSAGCLAALHFGYKAVTGECPCNVRRAAQYRLAMVLLAGLAAEGYLEMERSGDAGTVH